MATAIELSVIQSVTNIVKKDILISPATLTKSELDKIGATVITGVSNIESEFISQAYDGAIRAYDVTHNYTEEDAKEVSRVIERRLKVHLAYRPARLNLQQFKEKEPFDTTDKTSEEIMLGLPVTTYTLLQAGEYYGQEVIKPFFHGKRSLGKKHPLGIYDGILEHVAKDMTAYTDEEGNEVPVLIGKDLGNLIPTAPITKPTGTQDFSAYEVFESFVESLDPSLADNTDGVLVLVDKKRAPYIYQAYMNRYPNLQASVKFEGGYKFFTLENVTLVGTPLLGDTNTMIATRAGNLQMGIASERDGNNVSVKQHGIDPNRLFMWIQSYQGTRLLNPTKSHFAISCQEDYTLWPATPPKVGDLQLPEETEAED